ncbi:MAG: rRNA maturation RNase YbeY [Armatimonadota bacterium]
MGFPFSVENATESELELSKLQLALEKVCGIEEISQSVHVLVTTDQQVQELNQRFRGIDATTDVLTFPSGQNHPFPLGDIAISLPYAQRQASARGVGLEQELIALIVHGVLHLKGYDDVQDEDKLRMQTRMNEIGEMIGTPIDAFWTSVLHQEEE